MIRPDPRLRVYVTEKLTINLILATRRHPPASNQRITTREICNRPFSTDCSHVRVQGARAQLFGSAAADGAGLEVRTAGDRI
jgi:hypothetical protein